MLCFECHQQHIHARGRCMTCYWRYRASAAFIRVHARHPSPICEVDGCARTAERCGLCTTHYMRRWRAQRKAEKEAWRE